MESHSAVKKKKMLLFAMGWASLEGTVRWASLEGTVLSEISQTQTSALRSHVFVQS